MKQISANGLKGVLIFGIDTVFRVYNKSNFTDYIISMSDLEIQIKDRDAFLKEVNGEEFLDYSDETLGMYEKI